MLHVKHLVRVESKGAARCALGQAHTVATRFMVQCGAVRGVKGSAGLSVVPHLGVFG